MFKLLFSVLLTLSVTVAAVANSPIIAIYDFETPQKTLTELRKTWITHDGKHGKGLVIEDDQYAKSEIGAMPRVADNVVSFVAWVKMETFGNEGALQFEFIGSDPETARSMRTFDVESGSILRYTSFYTGPVGEISARGFGFKSEPQAILNKWHHIVYTQYFGVHKIFVDGQIVAQKEGRSLPVGGETAEIYIVGKFKGKAIVDDVGVFGIGLSNADVHVIYNQSLFRFVSMLPVDLQGKASTTWAALKSD
ncbi:MAG: hypothetical protein OXD49_03535 [Candidatus Poribacteria bacterium]|nr:hypothetical protein [Candidatus Poribacteria bacterium]